MSVCLSVSAVRHRRTPPRPAQLSPPHPGPAARLAGSSAVSVSQSVGRPAGGRRAVLRCGGRTRRQCSQQPQCSDINSDATRDAAGSDGGDQPEGGLRPASGALLRAAGLHRGGGVAASGHRVAGRHQRDPLREVGAVLSVRRRVCGCQNRRYDP